MDGGSLPPRGRMYPLNSGPDWSRGHLHSLRIGATLLTLLEETCQMIEGRLSEEHELCNVLVEQTEAAAGTVICLRDYGGVILRIEPEIEPELGSRREQLKDNVTEVAEETICGGASHDGGDAGGGDSQQLEQRLSGLLQENARLSEEKEELRGANTELLEKNEGLKV